MKVEIGKRSNELVKRRLCTLCGHLNAADSRVGVSADKIENAAILMKLDALVVNRSLLIQAKFGVGATQTREL